MKRAIILIVAMCACDGSARTRDPGGPSGSGGSGGGPAQPALKRQAAERYPSYRLLHESTVMPICGPRGGVCHNSRQYPDLHSADNMLEAIGQRCNQLTDDLRSIQDVCEPRGDLLLLKNGPSAGFMTRIGYQQLDSATPPQWARLTVRDPLPTTGTSVDFSIVRDSDPARPVELRVGTFLDTQAGQTMVTVARLQTVPAATRAFFTATFVPGFPGQLVRGDPNQNGTFGAELGGANIVPGDPSKSFFVMRILGTVPPKMPLANGNLDDVQVYALQCWIAQMAPDGSNADGSIDYAACPDNLPTQLP